MAILVSNLSIPFDQPPQEAFAQARAKAGLKPGQGNCYLVKSSIDARRRGNIRRVYTVGIQLDDPLQEQRILSRIEDPTVRLKPPEEPLSCPRGKEILSSRPVVVGFGPGGMFAALLLAREGYRPIVLERGEALERRVELVERYWKTGVLDSQTNVQFGEGGAGTFSDGKLTTRIGDSRCSLVLQELYRHGAPSEILQLAKPHIGTDHLRKVVKSIREEIIRLGGELHFGEQLIGFRLSQGRISGVVTSRGELDAQAVVLAIGHSARDTFQLLDQLKVPMEPKAFSVGVRVEQLQQVIDRGLYGQAAGHPLLPPGEYQLSYRENGGADAVYTFCMCPGGFVVPSASEPETVVTNGMSEFARNQPNANSALVVSVGPEQYGHGILDGMNFQRTLEQAAFQAGGRSGKAPCQDTLSFLEGRKRCSTGGVIPSYALGTTPVDFAQLFDRRITRMLQHGLGRFERQLPGFAGGGRNPAAVMTGVETRTSSPVRILRGEDCQSAGLPGLYPCGEGAGYAGGIMSAAVDGLRVAQALIARYGELHE